MRKFVFEKLLFSQLVKNFPPFYGTWRFVALFTRVYHISTPWSRMKLFCSRPYYFFKINFYTVLPSMIFLANEKQNIMTQIIVSFLILNLLLIYLCMQFWFVTTFSKNVNSLFFSKDLLPVFVLWFCPEFCWQEINLYLGFWIITSDQHPYQ